MSDVFSTPQTAGQWITPARAASIPERLDAMLHGQGRIDLAWVGIRGGDPVRVKHSNGKTSELPHAPVSTFSARLEELARQLGGDLTTSPATLSSRDIYQRRREAVAATSQPAGERQGTGGNHPTTASGLDPDAVYRRRQQTQGNEN